LYLDGEKLSRHLKAQRSYLRSRFEKIDGEQKEQKLAIVESIAKMAEFRQYYWHWKGSKPRDSRHETTPKEEKFCLKFIRDMKTSLAIPILSRYYWEDINSFADVVKAVTAFLVLRRSMTGKTANIDSDFRSLMKGEKNYEGLCVGIDHSNSLMNVDALKKILVDKIKRKLEEISPSDKDKISNNKDFKKIWCKVASQATLGADSPTLCRFLLFAAAHYSLPDENNLGCFKKMKPDEGRFFLHYERWEDEKYQTIEHVAPEEPSSGWLTDTYKSIYNEPNTKETIGNIILLPKAANSSVGNDSWDNKKQDYSTFTESETALAQKSGYNSKERLPILDSIVNVEEWTSEIIHKRTKNILELAGEEIFPWLSNPQNFQHE